MKIRQQNRVVRREKENFLKLFVSAVVTLSVFERYYLPFALFFHLLVIYCLSTHYTSREPRASEVDDERVFVFSV